MDEAPDSLDQDIVGREVRKGKRREEEGCSNQGPDEVGPPPLPRLPALRLGLGFRLKEFHIIVERKFYIHIKLQFSR